jgi:bifunctional non-homologous end joining protein LigD
MREADWLAFDLDPSSGEFADAVRAGRALKAALDDRKLPSYPKTSGSRGLHVFVPLRSGQSQDLVTMFAVTVGEELARREPALVTMEWRKNARGARVYADPFRNAYLQTIVAPYSVRRRAHAPVSTPLDWDEVTGRLDPAKFNVRTFAKRLAKRDPWADFKKRAVTLQS